MINENRCVYGSSTQRWKHGFADKAGTSVMSRRIQNEMIQLAGEQIRGATHAELLHNQEQTLRH